MLYLAIPLLVDIWIIWTIVWGHHSDISMNIPVYIFEYSCKSLPGKKVPLTEMSESTFFFFLTFQLPCIHASNSFILSSSMEKNTLLGTEANAQIEVHMVLGKLWILQVYYRRMGVCVCTYFYCCGKSLRLFGQLIQNNVRTRKFREGERNNKRCEWKNRLGSNCSALNAMLKQWDFIP